jgi:hypothetical protein
MNTAPRKLSNIAMVMVVTISFYVSFGLRPAFSNGSSSYESAFQTYLYAYPMVLMETTRLKTKAPNNSFVHLRQFPAPSDKDVVRPNADTLYSIAWLDLSNGPLLLSVPDTSGRYYLLQMMDMWTDVFAALGARTTGTGKNQFLIIGPDSKNTLPEYIANGTTAILAPTNQVWILGRTQTNGAADYNAVYNIQNGYTIAPVQFSYRRGMSRDPVSLDKLQQIIDANPSLTPPQIVAKMDAGSFFETFSNLLTRNSPHNQDWPMLKLMQRIGIAPGNPFSYSSLDSATQAEVETGTVNAKATLAGGLPATGSTVNNWSINKMFVGNYGTSYFYRAGIALNGLGANLPEDAIYPMTLLDDHNAPLRGSNRYVIHFDSGQIPPVNAFWSITLYDANGYFAANPLNRYNIGSRDALMRNADGSIDIVLQNTSPDANQEANWLPTPTGSFNLTMRMYWPTSDALYGTSWKIPAVTKMTP